MRKVAFVMAMLLVTLSVPSVTYSAHRNFQIDFYAYNIGSVVVGCDPGPCSLYCRGSCDNSGALPVCTGDGGPCYLRVEDNTELPLITLTATSARGPETGNHFAGWKFLDFEGKNVGTDTSHRYTFDPDESKIYRIEAVFKVERCFGAVGSGCGLTTDDSFNSGSKTYPQYGPDTNSNIAVGSILHDGCCLKHPTGYNCGFGNTDPSLCRKEWDKAVGGRTDESEGAKWIKPPLSEPIPGVLGSKTMYGLLGGRHTWKPSEPFGPYAANMGDPLDILSSPPSSLPDRMKAPDGTKLAEEDVGYCRAGSFKEEPKNGFGICGPGCRKCRESLKRDGIQRDAKGGCVMPERISTTSYACCYDKDSIKECAEEEKKGSSK